MTDHIRLSGKTSSLIKDHGGFEPHRALNPKTQIIIFFEKKTVFIVEIEKETVEPNTLNCSKVNSFCINQYQVIKLKVSI